MSARTRGLLAVIAAVACLVLAAPVAQADSYCTQQVMVHGRLVYVY